MLSLHGSEPVLRWLRSCAHCSISLPPIDLLCEECWSDFGKASVAWKPKSELPFPLHTLISWSGNDESLVARTIHGFKGGASPRAARVFARLLAGTYEKSRFHPNTRIVPAPGRAWNHALALAVEIGKILQFPVVDGLVSLDGLALPNQKSLTRNERFSRRYGLNEQGERLKIDIAQGAPVIFVDDVVTTGATAMAAYMALGDPEKGFEVWSIAVRPKLEKNTPFC